MVQKVFFCQHSNPTEKDSIQPPPRTYHPISFSYILTYIIYTCSSFNLKNTLKIRLK